VVEHPGFFLRQDDHAPRSVGEPFEHLHSLRACAALWSAEVAYQYCVVTAVDADDCSNPATAAPNHPEVTGPEDSGWFTVVGRCRTRWSRGPVTTLRTVPSLLSNAA
jgi:hypothetical protein